MSAITEIAWTDRTWNPVRGCSLVSDGCRSCYAMKQAHRFSGLGKPYEGLTRLGPKGPTWTGEVRTIESALLEPLSWGKPSRIFVNSMSDLFHEDIDPLFVGRVFNVMGQAERHTFQVLTKRPARMLDLVTEYYRAIRSEPYPNVWLGVSVENRLWRSRINELRQTPAAVRFVSFEPLLEDVSDGLDLTGIHWAIWGGESGPGARRAEIDWYRRGIAACRRFGTAPFMKQLGANLQDRNDAGFEGDPGDNWTPHTRYEDLTAQGWQGDPVRILLRDRKGGDIAEWPADLRVREFPASRQRDTL